MTNEPRKYQIEENPIEKKSVSLQLEE